MAEIQIDHHTKQAEYRDRLHGKLMVFTKFRLFLLLITSMMIGIGFFLIGYGVGYHEGKEKAVELVNQAILHPAQAIPALREAIETIESKNNHSDSHKYKHHDKDHLKPKYEVHIGLFTTDDYAKEAWDKAKTYSRLNAAEAILKLSNDKENLYKVRLGKFHTKEEAKLFAQNIIDNTTANIYPVVEDYDPKLNQFGDKEHVVAAKDKKK